VLIKDSKWTKLYFGEGQAALSFTHLNKDDEGLYTLRMVTKGGVSEYSAYLFVRGKLLICFLGRFKKISRKINFLSFFIYLFTG